jgi:hypothetical protein
MPTIEEKYDQNRIDVLKRYLQREATNGRPRDYEILVDGFKVIPRTRNLDEFDDYEIEMREDTRNVSILVYDGPATPRNTKYSFRVEKQQERLDGIGNGLGAVEQLIRDKLDENERIHELEKLKETLDATQQKLREAEEYCGQLEEQLEENRANKYKLGSLNIAELGAQVLEYTIKRHAHKIPGGEQLAGFLNAPILVSPQPEQEAQTEATFQKQEESPLTDVQMRHLNNLHIMERRLKGNQMSTTLAILSKLAEHPEQIDIVAALLNIEIKK